jgi:hypothetical protein
MRQSVMYEIRVEGQLSAHWSEWFDGLEILNDPCGQTVLRGDFVDQASLFGALNKIQGLNLTLVSVNRSNPDE